jgi:hypothetical protein
MRVVRYLNDERLVHQLNRQSHLRLKYRIETLLHMVEYVGTEVSFRQASETLREHDGLDLPMETIWRRVDGHAQALLAGQVLQMDWPRTPYAAWLLAAIAGGMAPIVTPTPASPSQHKGPHSTGKRPGYAWRTPSEASLPCEGALQGGIDVAARRSLSARAGRGWVRRRRDMPWATGDTWSADQGEPCFAPRRVTCLINVSMPVTISRSRTSL